ncbi:MAG: jacalin-like lectin [Massilibacteroides sp.]|nr:jacalin-like lectin [Massilibacteroides sp.]
MKKNLFLTHALLEGEGENWTDLFLYQSLPNENKFQFPSKIAFRSGAFMDSIKLFYDDQELPGHGGPGGDYSSVIQFDDDEYIKKVTVEYCSWNSLDTMITKLLFDTNKREKIGLITYYTPEKSETVEYVFPEGFALACLGGKVVNNFCVSALTLYACPIKDSEELTVYGILNDNLNYLRLKTEDSLKEDVEYCFPIKTSENTEIICASVSSSVGDVSFKVDSDFSAALKANKDKRLYLHSVDDKDAFIMNDPKAQTWLLKFKATKGAKFDFKALSFIKDLPRNTANDSVELLKLISNKDFTHQDLFTPVTKAVEQAVWQQVNSDTDKNWLFPFVKIPAALATVTPPWGLIAGLSILAAAVVVGAIVVAVKSSKGNTPNLRPIFDDAFDKEAEKRLQEKDFWNWSPSCDVYQPLNGWRKEYPDEFECKSSTRSLYEKIYQRFNGAIEVSKIGKESFIDSNFLTQYSDGFLHVDIGGEGCFLDGDLKSGFNDAINLSGRRDNYYKNKFIPLLLHFDDWTTNDFPFKDGIITKINMQGITSPLTKKQADEIIRCINRDSGIIEVETNENNRKLLIIMYYIAKKIGCIVETLRPSGGYAFPKYVIDVKNKTN